MSSGAKAVVDFKRNGEKRVTVARVHPSGSRLLVMRGVLTGSDGWDKDNLGCSVEAVIKPVDGPQLEELGRLLGIDVEIIS
jgi:hypothetical protein